MKHYACYWCHALVAEDRAKSARLGGGIYWWHEKCAKVDPLYPESGVPVYRHPVGELHDE